MKMGDDEAWKKKHPDIDLGPRIRHDLLHDKGFSMHKVAEELRMEGKGSSDPMYNESHKNK